MVIGALVMADAVQITVDWALDSEKKIFAD